MFFGDNRNLKLEGLVPGIAMICLVIVSPFLGESPLVSPSAAVTDNASLFRPFLGLDEN